MVIIICHEKVFSIFPVLWQNFTLNGYILRKAHRPLLSLGHIRVSTVHHTADVLDSLNSTIILTRNLTDLEPGHTSGPCRQSSQGHGWLSPEWLPPRETTGRPLVGVLVLEASYHPFCAGKGRPGSINNPKINFKPVFYRNQSLIPTFFAACI